MTGYLVRHLTMSVDGRTHNLKGCASYLHPYEAELNVIAYLSGLKTPVVKAARMVQAVLKIWF